MLPSSPMILLTTASGAGCGLLVLLGVFSASDKLPAEPWFAVVAFGLTLGALTFGPLATAFHLSHPARASRAYAVADELLSRQAVLATVTYAPALLLNLAVFEAAPLAACIQTVAPALSASAGVAVERWLFFAEAKHTVRRYQGIEAT